MKGLTGSLRSSINSCPDYIYAASIPATPGKRSWLYCGCRCGVKKRRSSEAKPEENAGLHPATAICRACCWTKFCLSRLWPGLMKHVACLKSTSGNRYLVSEQSSQPHQNTSAGSSVNEWRLKRTVPLQALQRKTMWKTCRLNRLLIWVLWYRTDCATVFSSTTREH